MKSEAHLAIRTKLFQQPKQGCTASVWSCDDWPSYSFLVFDLLLFHHAYLLVHYFRAVYMTDYSLQNKIRKKMFVIVRVELSTFLLLSTLYVLMRFLHCQVWEVENCFIVYYCDLHYKISYTTITFYDSRKSIVILFLQ